MASNLVLLYDKRLEMSNKECYRNEKEEKTKTEGFEPPDQFPDLQLSRLAQSSALPNLQYDSGRIRTCGPASADLPDSSRMHSSTMRRCQSTPGGTRTHTYLTVSGSLVRCIFQFCYRGKVGGVGLEPTLFLM